MRVELLIYIVMYSSTIFCYVLGDIRRIDFSSDRGDDNDEAVGKACLIRARGFALSYLIRLLFTCWKGRNLRTVDRKAN